MFWRALRTTSMRSIVTISTRCRLVSIGELRRKPVIYDDTRVFPICLGVVFRQLFFCRALTFIEDLLIRRVRLLITVGDRLRSYFETRGARNVIVIGNWKRLSEYARTPDENSATRRVLNIPENAFAIVCITQLLRDRKLQEVMDAVDLIPDLHLIVGGAGVLRDEVINRSRANARIHYIGFVKSSDVPSYTCAATRYITVSIRITRMRNSALQTSCLRDSLPVGRSSPATLARLPTSSGEAIAASFYATTRRLRYARLFSVCAIRKPIAE